MSESRVTLKEARSMSELSQEKVAVRAGIAVATYRRIEDGRVTDPSHSTVLAICAVLGVEPGEITEFARPMKESVV